MDDAEYRKLSMKEQFENYIYNMKFYFDFSGDHLITQTKDRVHLLGKIYQAIHKNNVKEENHKIKKHF